MRCEVCGNKIFGKPYTAIIEGAKLAVCRECVKHGKIIHEQPQRQPTIMATHKPMPLQRRSASRKPPETPSAETGTELVENYQTKIRQAREKLGLSHEDLGKRIKLQIETAELLCGAVRAEKLRFTTSGTLATMYALLMRSQ